MLRKADQRAAGSSPVVVRRTSAIIASGAHVMRM